MQLFKHFVNSAGEDALQFAVHSSSTIKWAPKFNSFLKAAMHSLTAGIPFETNSTALIATWAQSAALI